MLQSRSTLPSQNGADRSKRILTSALKNRFINPPIKTLAPRRSPTVTEMFPQSDYRSASASLLAWKDGLKQTCCVSAFARWRRTFNRLEIIFRTSTATEWVTVFYLLDIS